jgi:hypothetical protein
MGFGGGGNARAKYDISAEDKTKKALQSAKKGFDGVSSSVKALGAVGVAVLGAAGLGAAVTRFASQVATGLDQAAKSANRLGTTVEQLDALTFAAELGGASAGSVEKAWKAASKALVDAADGIGIAKVELDRMGISATDAAGNVKSVDQVMIEFADRLPLLASETAKLSAVQKVFGKSGADLLPALRQGADAMREQIIEGRTLSVRTAELTRKGEDQIDAQLRLNRAWRSAKDVVAGSLLPTLSSLTELLATKLIGLVTGLSEEFREFLATAALEGPDTQILLLNQRLEETRAAMVPIKEESKEISRQLKLSADAGRHLNAVTLQGLKDNNKELAGHRKEEESILFAIEQAEKAKARQKALEVDIRAARQFTLQNTIDQATAEGVIEESKIRQRILDAQSVAAAEDSRDLLEEMAAPEFNVKWLPEPDDMLLALDRYSELAGIVGNIGDTISNQLGNEMAEFVQTGRTGADIFGRVWKSAMSQLLGDLTAAIAKATLLSAINLVTSGGLGSLFGRPAGIPVEKTNLAPAAGDGAVYFVNQSLIPGTTADFLRANLAVQEANFRNNRFAMV